MVIYHVLDEVFRSWSHTAVLRALLDSASGSKGNERLTVIGRSTQLYPPDKLYIFNSIYEKGHDANSKNY